ncbi:MAG TPA: hypothetical protein VFL47_04835, partial [Flavisolibacter sp.]|nr:hypothetical protein [Flavisolibacter sp.]
MKKLTILSGVLALLVGSIGCQKDGIDDDTSFLSTAVPSSPGKLFDISNDNSGNVTITPTGEGVSKFTVKYGHGTGAAAQADVKPGFNTTH